MLAGLGNKLTSLKTMTFSPARRGIDIHTISDDIKMMSSAQLNSKYLFVRQNPPYWKQSDFSANTSPYTQTFVDVESMRNYYSVQIAVPRSIDDNVQDLLTVLCRNYICYLRRPFTNETVHSKNLKRASTKIQGPPSGCGRRPDANEARPYSVPILLKEDEDAVRRHEELCTFLNNLTIYLGREENDEWEAFLIKYVGEQWMGEHGDYGGVKSEKYFMMRLTLGLGGSRTIRFRAKRIGENASSDRAGKLLNGIDFELVLPSGVNAYLQSPFGSGKNLLGFFDNDGVRGCLHLYTEILMLRLLWLIFLCAQLRMF